jgi:SAM-dependent methyltransferase
MIALKRSLQIHQGRWVAAQTYERGYWERLSHGIAEGAVPQLDWYKWRAARLEHLLSTLREPPSVRGCAVEIGSGPIGIVNFLDWKDRYAIDPLEGFYRQQQDLVRLRQPGAVYIEGGGEHLPIDSGSASLVIIDNVIDHTYAPDRIMNEIYRVLEPAGRLYLVVNVHTRWGALLHTLLAALGIDKGHPHTFTSQALRRFLARHKFSILLEDVERYDAAKQADRESTKRTDRIKGYTGLSEFQHLVICSKHA